MSKQVTPNNLDDKQKAKMLENRILFWGKVVEELVPDLLQKEYNEKFYALAQKGETPSSNDIKLLNQAHHIWDKTIHFLVVTLGNIAKNIRLLIRNGNYSSPEIKKEAQKVWNEYNNPQLVILRNLLEHEPEYIVGSDERNPKHIPYVKNVRSGKQSAFIPSKNNPNTVEINIQIFDSPQFRIDPMIESVKNLHDAIQKNRQPRKMSS